jgi:hypothetical protein
MSQQIETFASAASTILSAIAGSKFGSLVAVAGASQMPEWMQWILGPFGALIGVLLALHWMSRRLNAAEAREEARRIEREADRKATTETLMSLIRDSNSVATAATQIMRDVRQAIERCPTHDPQRRP